MLLKAWSSTQRNGSIRLCLMIKIQPLGNNFWARLDMRTIIKSSLNLNLPSRQKPASKDTSISGELLGIFPRIYKHTKHLGLQVSYCTVLDILLDLSEVLHERAGYRVRMLLL